MWRQKTPQAEQADKSPYTYYYPHAKPKEERKWNQGFLQIVSIDPGRKNFAFRIERRYEDGRVLPVVFDKVAVESVILTEGVTTTDTYNVLTNFLEKYSRFYKDCHYILIERQLPVNYQAVRISQHVISYFSLTLKDTLLLPPIIEVDPKLKGKMLGAPKGCSDSQLKQWAVEKAKEMFTEREDEYSLQVLQHFKSKQDDLSDTACQIEAFLKFISEAGASL